MDRHLFLFLTLLVTFGSCTHQQPKVEKIESSQLPSLYITLPSEQLDSIMQDKEHKSPAQALLLTIDGDTIFDGDLAHIKTRGNMSFQKDKKPFTIKFREKQNLFGLKKSRSFILLANAFDESHIRNAIAFDLARAIGLPSTEYKYLSLYINGEYYGLYQMTNKVEVGKHTLNIVDLDKENQRVNRLPLHDYPSFRYEKDTNVIHRKGIMLEQSPDDISGGYLLEINQHYGYFNNKFLSGFVASNGDVVGIRSPEYASEEEVEYIKSVYDSMVVALEPGSAKNLADYMDIHSFALYFLLQEVLQNTDGCIASFFMYKDQEEQFIHAGPVWDFDISINNANFLGEYSMPNELFVKRIRDDKDLVHTPSNLLYLMVHNPQFGKYVADLYLGTVSPKFHAYLESGRIDSLVGTINVDVERDNDKYHFRIDPSYEASLQRVRPFLERRLDFLDWYFASDSSERVCVTDVTDKAYPRYFYIPKGSGFELPEPFYNGGFSNNSMVPVWYYVGTNDELRDGTALSEDCSIELRWREPTWKEVLMRRIHKKLGKLNFVS